MMNKRPYKHFFLATNPQVYYTCHTCKFTNTVCLFHVKRPLSCPCTYCTYMTLHKPVWQAFHGHHFVYQLKIYYTFCSKVHTIILFFLPNIIIIKYAYVCITYNSDNNFDLRVCSGFNAVYL